MRAWSQPTGTFSSERHYARRKRSGPSRGRRDGRTNHGIQQVILVCGLRSSAWCRLAFSLPPLRLRQPDGNFPSNHVVCGTKQFGAADRVPNHSETRILGAGMNNFPLSQTAVGSALFRAVHPFIDDEPHLIYDPFALALAGWGAMDEAIAGFCDLEQKLASNLTLLGAQRFVRELRAVTVLRARLAEDLLSAAIARGVHQCVILGAGLDSMAHRREQRWQTCTFFEVDRPQMQTWKLEQLLSLGSVPDANVAFVPWDFDQSDLMVALASKGFRAFEPAFVVWLGVTPYLSSSSILETLQVFSRWCPGSEMLFDYIVQDAWLDDFGRAAVDALRQEMSDLGEPGESSFSPLEIGRWVIDLGFRDVHRYEETELNATYFSGRRDELALPTPCSARWVSLRI